MRKITAGIIDDEQDGREYIALLLHICFPEIEIIFQEDNIESSYFSLTKTWPDILFLDVVISDHNIFELLDKFKYIPSQIIFITAYEQYALKAIKSDATDFILKPINKMDFAVAVNKAILDIDKNLLLSQTQANTPLPNPAPTEDIINLPTLQGFRRIRIDDIVRCQADANYTIVYLSNQPKITVSRMLHDVENHLGGKNFFRIHHKHLINLKHLKEYVKGRGGEVIMSDGSVINVSVRKKNEFIQRISKLN